MIVPRRRLPRDRTLTFAIGLLVALVLACVLVPLFAPGDPLAIGDVLSLRLLPPFTRDAEGHWHLLGTDRFGRDLFVRMMLAGRVSLAVGVMLIYGTLGLPEFSNPDAPIHVHVVPRYLNESKKEVDVPNVVTAVLASYRGYDTLGETTVVFTAGAGVVALLRRRRKDRKP